MKRDLILTLAVEVLILFCGLYVYRLAFNVFGDQGFATYNLCRRIISLTLPAALCGMGVAIPRYIAFGKGRGDDSSGYVVGGAINLMATGTAIFLILNLFPNFFAHLFFDDEEMANLIFPLSLMLIALLAHGLCYAYYRGHIQMLRANLMQFINLGVIPVAVFSVCHNLHDIFIVTASIILFVTTLVFVIGIQPRLTKSFNSHKTKELLSYGWQRVPADFCAAALYGLPPIFATHAMGLTYGGYMAFGISLLQMCGAVFAPVGLVMLPNASRLIAHKDFDVLKRHMNRLMVVTFILATCGTLVYEIFAPFILKIYLGKQASSELLAVTRTVMLAAIPFSFYVTQRSLIDAYFVHSVNTLNIVLTLSLFLAMIAFWKYANVTVLNPSIALISAVYLLGSLTLYSCLIINKLIIKEESL